MKAKTPFIVNSSVLVVKFIPVSSINLESAVSIASPRLFWLRAVLNALTCNTLIFKFLYKFIRLKEVFFVQKGGRDVMLGGYV